ncbi:MAG: class B sortase [Candidatus Coprovivens sp.]
MKKDTPTKKLFYLISIILLLILLCLSINKLISSDQKSSNYLNQDKIDLKDIENKEIEKEPEKEDNIKEEPSEYEIAKKYFSSDINLDTYRNKYNNPEIVARLEIPNLFNILITQSSDNKYYLDHSIEKKKDVKGTEFMDYRITPTSKQVNIYGHNSRTYDIPFRKIEKLLDKDTFDKTPYILLQHDGGIRIYKIVSIKETTGNEHMYVFKENEEFVNHVQNLISDSVYTRSVPYDKDSNILTIQTCSYSDDKTYYVITAIELK